MEVLRDPVVIGVISAPHGVRGTLRVKSLGAGRHLRCGVEPVVEGERRRILAARETPKGFLIDLEGIEDRDLAGSLRGSKLLLGREELDTPEEGEFYVRDLVGLEAHDEAGACLGSIADILETPAHEVLVVQDFDEEIYVPFTFEHVPKVDLEGGHIVVSPPETFSE